MRYLKEGAGSLGVLRLLPHAPPQPLLKGVAKRYTILYCKFCTESHPDKFPCNVFGRTAKERYSKRALFWKRLDTKLGRDSVRNVGTRYLKEGAGGFDVLSLLLQAAFES